MLEQRLPPPPTWPQLHSKFGALKNGVPKYVPQDALIEAFETAQAETTARIRAGLSLPASPEAKSSTGSRSFWPGSRRRYGSEPPPSPSRRLLGMELPQPPLPPVAGELKVRLEALEMDAKRLHLQEVERIRGICAGLQDDLDMCRRSLEEKSRQEDQAQKEISRLRAEVERFRHQRNDSKEVLRLKEALSLLEQSDLEKSHRLEMEQQESLRLQAERDALDSERRSSELKERQLREKLEAEKYQELQKFEADCRRLTENLERAEEDNRHLRKALKEREKAESELRDSLTNLKGKAMSQKQQQIDQLSEENRSLKILVQELEQEKGRWRGLERSQIEQLASSDQDRQTLRMKLQEALESEEELRRQVSRLQQEETKHLQAVQANQRLEKDVEHLRKALKQRRNAEKDLREAIDEQKRLRAQSVQSEESTPSPVRASFTEPMGVRRSLAAGLPGVPSLPGRAGRAVTLGDFAAEMVEVDLTSRLSSKESSLMEVDLTRDL